MQINNIKFKRRLLRLSSALTYRPKATLVIFCIFILLCTSQIQKLKSLYDINDLVDKDFNTYSGLQLLNSEFDDKNQFQLIFSQKNWSEKNLCSLRKIITEFYLSRSDIQRLNSTFGLKKFIETSDAIKIKDLIQLNCDNPSTEDSNNELSKINTSPWNHILNSKNSEDVVVQMGLADNEAEGRFGNFNPEIIDGIETFFKEKMRQENLNLEMRSSGLVAFKYHLKKGYQVLQAMNGLSLIICLFIFWYFYSSAKAACVFMTSVLFTTIIIYGGMALIGHPIDMLTNALPLMLTMSCLEDFIFVCHFRSYGYSFKKTFHKIIVPSFLTSLTTAIGFGSLMFSELSILRRFGLWAAAGSMIEWFILFLIFPAALIVFPKIHFKTVSTKMVGLDDFQFPKIKYLKWLAFAVIPLSILAANQLHIDDSPEKLFSNNHVMHKTFLWLKENKGWTAEFSILTKTNNFELQQKIDDTLLQRPEIIAVESPLVVENYLVEGISQPYQAQLKKQWKESSFAHRLISENNISRHISYINTIDVKTVNELHHFLNTSLCTTQDLNTCIVAGSTISYGEFGGRILKSLLESLILSLLLVAGVIFIFRTTDVKTTGILILTSLWGPLALIVFFGAFQISIFYVTSICASLLVGLAGDNAIQFMYFSKKINKSVDFLQGASLRISIGMMMLCSIMFLAPFTSLISLGGIFILSFILLYFGDVVILKSFIGPRHD